MEYLKEIIVPGIVFASMVITVIAILNFILKLRIINTGTKDQEYIKLLAGSFSSKFNALKWGLILLWGGLGLVVIDFLPQDKIVGSSLPFGLEAIFLSIGILVYYLIVRKEQA